MRTPMSAVSSSPARALMVLRAFSRALAYALFAALAAAPFAAIGAPVEKDAAKPARPRVGAALKAAKDADRREALEKLLYRRGDAAEAEIVAALSREPKPDIRAGLLRALTGKGGEAAVLAIVDALIWDGSPLVRSAAAHQLARLRGGRPAEIALIEHLQSDPDADVRGSCAVALAYYHTPRAVAALARAAKDPDPGLRRSAALALSRQPKGAERDKALDALEADPEAEIAEKARRWRGEGKTP